MVILFSRVIRYETFSKGVGFLAHYMHIRLQPNVRHEYTKSTKECIEEILSTNKDKPISVDVLSDIGRVQETFYNVGRVYFSVRMNHLAHFMFEKALDIADKNPELLKSSLHVTREAAFNLFQLYRISGANELAMQVMQKYLNYD